MMMMMMMMMKFFLLLALLLPLLVAGEETFELLHPLPPTSPPTLAVSLADQHLLPVSSSVLSAEHWLRTHVLAHYPSANITTILLGTPHTLCYTTTTRWSLLLPAAKNLRHSLARWSLLGDIRVSAAFSSRCFDDPSRADALRPLLRFLEDSGIAPYTIHSHAAYESAGPSLASFHRSSSLETTGFPRFTDVRITRLLTSPSSPLLRSRGKRLFAPVPRGSFSFAPASPPVTTVPPPSPPDLPADPPVPFCIPPAVAEAPAPGTGGAGEKAELWCVAKPTVPEDKLQEAMDFACGAGGADCEQIRPNGDCFNPDNLVAHASYAFNSYWQKTKQSGGSCVFDGTAILINSDPSFLQCRFELS